MKYLTKNPQYWPRDWQYVRPTAPQTIPRWRGALEVTVVMLFFVFVLSLFGALAP